mmetsp:Transcript_20877/g.58721  ORF Transcript_20877/g.58721 Transcript_20877/m.58721 type:complete len:91 (+) Transcript_20877:78-350(+)
MLALRGVRRIGLAATSTGGVRTEFHGRVYYGENGRKEKFIDGSKVYQKLRKEGRRKSEGEMMDRLDKVYEYQYKRKGEKQKEKVNSTESK